MSVSQHVASAPPARRRPVPSASAVRRRVVEGDLGSLRVVIELAVIWAIFEIAKSNFLTAVNLTNLALQITGTALISIGVVLVLLLAEVDLSVGAVSGFAAGVTAVLSIKHGWAPVPAIAAGVATGAGIGLLQGIVATRFGIPSFIITLAGLLAWQGALLQVLGPTVTVNLTDPTIVGIANTFYSPAVSWSSRASRSLCTQAPTSAGTCRGRARALAAGRPRAS